MTDQEELEAFFSMHTGVLTAKRRDHLREVFARVLAAAESRGYERAREQAAQKADARAKTHEEWGRHAEALDMDSLADDIRAMTDERARGERHIPESDVRDALLHSVQRARNDAERAEVEVLAKRLHISLNEPS